MRWLEVLAVSVYTLSLTGSAFDVALMYFARTCPTLLCAPWAGALAERLPRRSLLSAGFGLMFVTSGVLAGLAFAGVLELWQVALGAITSGVFWSLEHTVRRTAQQQFGLTVLSFAQARNRVRRLAARSGCGPNVFARVLVERHDSTCFFATLSRRHLQVGQNDFVFDHNRR